MESNFEFQNPRTFSPVEPRICIGIWNSALGIPESKFHRQGICNPQIHDCLGLLWLILQKMLQRSCWLTTTRGFPSTGPGLWAPGLNKKIQTYFLINREEKSLRHIAMVAKVLDDNKPKKSLTARSPKA